MRKSRMTVLAASVTLLAACAHGGSAHVTAEPVCPPLAVYTDEDQSALADEVERFDAPVTARFLTDYWVLYGQVAAVCD